MIELLLINAFIIFGIYASLQENMIFEKVGNLLYDWKEGNKLQRFIRKPLGACPVCMASIYGFPVYWFYYFINPFGIILGIFIYICYSFALAGLNMIILSLITND